MDQIDVPGTSTTLAGNTPTEGTGLWTIVSGSGGSVTTPTSPTSGFTGIAGNSYILEWTITNVCGSSTDSVTISFEAPADPYPCISKTFGGSGTDAMQGSWEISNMIATSDGGYAIAGITDSWGAGNNDIWILKLDASASIEWQYAYGSGNNEEAYCIIQTSDGGYAVTGRYNRTGSYDGELWVLKLDASGNINWQKRINGTSNQERGISIIETSDGGYAIAGQYHFGSASPGGEMWVVKLNSSGNISWQMAYGGTYEEVATGIAENRDGDLVVAGKTATYGSGSYDVWMLKVNGSNGNTIWRRAYGTADVEQAIEMTPTDDGCYVINGRYENSPRKFLLMKVDDDGNIVWQKCYTDDTNDYVGQGIIQTDDGGYASVGYGAAGGLSSQFLINKLDASGNLVWQKHFGLGDVEMATSIVQTSTGNYAVAGVTYNGAAGGLDIMFFKIQSDGSGPDCDGTPPGFVRNISLSTTSTTAVFTFTSASAVNSTAIRTITGAVINEPCTCP
ncbi:MAG: hypothetical protein ACP5G4_06500 [bacterium]